MVIMYTESTLVYSYFFFNDTATTEIYTLSLHDALPISGPGAATGKLQFRADTLIVGKDMVAMPVRLYVVIVEIERAEGLHAGHAELRAEVYASVFPGEAAACDLVPGLAGQFRNSLVGLAAQGHVTSGLAEG